MAYQKLAQALNDSVKMYTPDVLYPRECLIVGVNEDDTLRIKVNIGENIYLDEVRYIGIPKTNTTGLFIPLNNNYDEGYCICYNETTESLTENIIINNYNDTVTEEVNEVNESEEETSDEISDEITEETQTNINYDRRYAKLDHTHTENIGTIEDLKTLIKNTKEGNILSLSRNFKNERYGNIIINKKITIDGNGHSIENISFTCDANEMELNNIVFFNNTTNRVNGGALQLNGQKISINNCIFYNNIINGTSVYEGGAISVNASSVETKIVDCYFISNFCSNNGGAVRWIANNGVMIGCRFIGNIATNSGGAIKWLGTDGLIRECLFENNKSNNAKDILTTDENLIGIGNKFLTESDVVGSEKFYDYINELDKREIEAEIHSSFGRNILYDTQEMIGGTLPNNVSYSGKFRENKVLYFDDESSNTNGYRDWQYDIPIGEFNYGDEFTFSFWVKSDKENIGKVKAYFYGGTDYIKTKVINSNGYDSLDGFSDGHITFDVNDEWKKCFVTWKLDSTGNLNIYKRAIVRIYDGAKIYLSSPKLERGKVATDWTPNPNDKLNKNAHIQLNDDLNDYRKTGIYRCLMTNTARTVSNLPLEFSDTRANAFVLNVEETTSNGCKQTLTLFLIGKVFEYDRTFYNGSWGQWQIKSNQVNCVCYTTANSGTGTGGFAKIMKIKNISNTTWYNTAIGFDVYQRNRKFPVRCYLKFKNENVQNFNIDSFYYYGENSDIYIINSEDKEWDLYIRKTETGDTIEIKNLTVNDSYTTKYNKLEFYPLNEECLIADLPYDSTDTHSAKAVKSDYCLDKQQTDSYYLSLNGGSLNGNLTVNGNIVGTNLTVNNDIIGKNDLTISRNATISNNIIGKNATINNDLTVSRNATINNDLTVNNNIIGKKDLTLTGTATINSNLTVSGNATVNNNIIGKKDLTVNGSATIDNDLTVKNNANVNNNLTVKTLSVYHPKSNTYSGQDFHTGFPLPTNPPTTVTYDQWLIFGTPYDDIPYDWNGYFPLTVYCEMSIIIGQDNNLKFQTAYVNNKWRMNYQGTYSHIPTYIESANGVFKFDISKTNGKYKILINDILIYDGMNTLQTKFQFMSDTDGFIKGDGVANYITADTVSIIDLIYPIGSIYMSVNDVNPGSLFGGQWEKLKDRFLLGSGDNYTNGATGGSKDATLVKHNHYPSGENYFVTNDESGASNYRVGNATSGKWVDAKDNSGTFHHTQATNFVGSDATGKNMPPYLAVNIWKRIG